jgi:hypothetical protein
MCAEGDATAMYGTLRGQIIVCREFQRPPHTPRNTRAASELEGVFR